LSEELVEINNLVNTQMNSKYLSLEIEEVIRKCFFMDGRKSYCALYQEKEDFKTWTRESGM